ncbi:Hypothetical protein PP7435_CHR2-1002 [Komagataella phaffii CBS 7435]|uniref:Uncharacterized protein n=1 Tax=Komagataella phaffii (strain ATCC 76273 / CBS 7435 / CECT 11047 / NRRL Y-11430 / Wegner 21-1) TaxID=981350 RepID=F2QTF4_KOMPC|nr:Hypothetical protein BQ9382_C2-5392 [Komagataella phaffii CBS 7435]CCA38682.1 Hypothetical protein PP7435_CHR2-1002 [Komagataella phaffii CBS 7435]
MQPSTTPVTAQKKNDDNADNSHQVYHNGNKYLALYGTLRILSRNHLYTLVAMLHSVVASLAPPTCFPAYNSGLILL